MDVIVKIGGAGVCRTDLHIIEGQWEAVQNPDLPYVLGHENAGWVHAVGEGASNLAVNGGVAAHAGFVQTFAGEAVDDLTELRRYFLETAVVAGQDRVARPLVDAGVGPDELAALPLGSAPPSADLDRLRQRRAALGLPDDAHAPLLLHPDGSRVTPAQVPLHLRRARLTRLGIEANGELCRSFLRTRYPAGTG